MITTTTNPSSPIVVGFGSIPGGTGCTTLAAHVAAFAARLGLHTLGISVDRNADMLRRLGGEEQCIDGHWHKQKRLKLAYCPPDLLTEVGVENVVDYLPNLGFGKIANPEIIILDLGPAEASRLAISADYWVVPVMDSRSMRSLMEQTFPIGKIATLFLRTQVSFGTPNREEIIRLLNEQAAPASVRLMHTEIPRSGLLRQAEWECKSIWELGTPTSLTRRRMDAFCNELLGIVATNLLSAANATQDDTRPEATPARITLEDHPSVTRPDRAVEDEDDDYDEDDEADEAPALTVEELFRKESTPKDATVVGPDTVSPTFDDSSWDRRIERVNRELKEVRTDIERLAAKIRIDTAREMVESVLQAQRGAKPPKTARARAVPSLSVRKKRRT
jgi:cellulose biosynthesis protein BcsQ